MSSRKHENLDGFMKYIIERATTPIRYAFHGEASNRAYADDYGNDKLSEYQRFRMKVDASVSLAEAKNAACETLGAVERHEIVTPAEFQAMARIVNMMSTNIAQHNNREVKLDEVAYAVATHPQRSKDRIEAAVKAGIMTGDERDRIWLATDKSTAKRVEFGNDDMGRENENHGHSQGE